MPCRGPDTDGFEELRQTREKLDRVTRLLCYVMDKGSAPPFNSSEDYRDLQAWWAEHQAMDEKRALEEQREKIREEKEVKDKQRLEELLSSMSEKDKKLLRRKFL